MDDLKVNLYPCAHCQQTGTCSNGKDGQSCAYCIKDNEVKIQSGAIGIPCSICGGIGSAEPRTERINKRMGSIIGLIVVMMLIALVIITLIGYNQHLPQVLTFSSTLLGIIFAFYFSRK